MEAANMNFCEKMKILSEKYLHGADQSRRDYFSLIKELVQRRNMHEAKSSDFSIWQKEVDRIYELVRAEIITNQAKPLNPVKFGTSGWRGIIGKDLYLKSVRQVTEAIIEVYREVASKPELAEALGVKTFSEMQSRGCVLGFDNRFGGELLAQAVLDVLSANNIRVYYAGESTTGVLSAALLELDGSFSINLTPSHNPLEYGGYKFNGSDGGPASALITNRITEKARKIIDLDSPIEVSQDRGRVEEIDSLQLWVNMVRRNLVYHGLDYDDIISRFTTDPEVVLAVDCVHGASRLHIEKLLTGGLPGEPHDRQGLKPLNWEQL
jgi:phosphomannomutase